MVKILESATPGGTGMTPEVMQEMGRRRITSRGHYQSDHDGISAVHSADFTNNLAILQEDPERVMRPRTTGTLSLF